MACIKKTFICSLVVSASFMAETMFLLFVWSFSDLRILAEEIRKCHAIDYRQMPTSYFFPWWGPLKGVRCHKLFAEYAFPSSASAEKESSPLQSFECCGDLWKSNIMDWMGDTLVQGRVRLWEFYWFAEGHKYYFSDLIGKGDIPLPFKKKFPDKGSCTYYVIADLGREGGLSKWLQYYIGVFRKIVSMYHESWGITSGILFP